MVNWPIQTLASDVLIIGGGAAALMAALEASRYTSRVTVVCKKRAGMSGNTIISGAGFSAFIPLNDSPDSMDQHFYDTIQGGKAINDKELVTSLVEEAGASLLELERYGVHFLRLKGELVRRHGPGHSYARTIRTVYGVQDYLVRGSSFLRPLLAEALKRGVKILNSTPVIQLVTENGSVLGGIGLDLTGQKVNWLPAKAVILAAGGGGRLFSQTNNTADITGDSFALGLGAGAILKDMEFIQFYPTMMRSPVRIAMSTPLFGDGAVLRNRQGERFMPKYLPRESDMATRDKMVQAIFSEIQAGYGVADSVYLDCTSISEQTIRTRYEALAELLFRHKLDIRRDWLLIGPTTHFVMGGIKIDRYCQTSIRGLFAAGESVGGVHGANRLSGNALTEAIVFGRLAAKSAAAFLQKVSRINTDAPIFDLPTLRPGKEDLMEISDYLRRAMWEHASIVRSRVSLENVLNVIKQCKYSLDFIGLSTFHEIATYLELSGMCEIAEVVVRSSLFREESRGSHFREDVPMEDPRWLGSIQVNKEKGRLKLAFMAAS